MVTSEQLEAMKPNKYNRLWRGFLTKRDLNIIGKWMEDTRDISLNGFRKEYENNAKAVKA